MAATLGHSGDPSRTSIISPELIGSLLSLLILPIGIVYPSVLYSWRSCYSNRGGWIRTIACFRIGIMSPVTSATSRPRIKFKIYCYWRSLIIPALTVTDLSCYTRFSTIKSLQLLNNA